MNNFPITFGLWILFVMIVVARKICIGRRRALQRQRYRSERGAETSSTAVEETPEERREKINQALITRKVVARDASTGGDQDDWWKTFRKMGSRPSIRFSEEPPGLVEETATRGGGDFEQQEMGDIEEGSSDEENKEDAKTDTHNVIQTNTVFDTISTSIKSLTEPGPATSCDICLAEYEVGEDVSWSPNKECPHAFHNECITDWLMTNSSCPCCRRNYLGGEDNLDESTVTTAAESRIMISASSSSQ